MPDNCAVADCKNVGGGSSKVVFHRFPKDEKTRKAWIIKCRRRDKFNPGTSKVCSEHFTPDDYERDLRNELLHLPIRKLLKRGSIPSVFCSRGKENSFPHFPFTPRNERVMRRSNHKIVDLLINDDHEVDKSETMPGNSDFCCQVEIKDIKLIEDNRRLRKEISELKLTIKNLRHRLKSHRKNKHQPRRTKTFSVAQIKKLKGQSRVNWETADIVKALSLRSVSLKAYETARNSWNLPLPAPSTLREWVHRFQCAPGLQSDILRILNEYSSSFGTLSKISAICFDEMSLDGRYELDNVNDQITSHSKVQVAMARGIADDWKQPIYFDFDKAMTVSILTTIITAVENAGIHVVSITSDMGAENRSLWKYLGISPDKPWFQNPFDKTRKVYVFADIPHLLKLMRNHIIDDGLMTEDGAVIDKDVLQTLVDTDSSGELKLCPNLTQRLIELTGVERMRVRPAAQLFSRHTAMLAKSVFAETMEIGNFIQVLNDGLDVFNSRCQLNPKNPMLSAFGVNMDQQAALLQRLKHTVGTSRFYLKTKTVGDTKKLKSALMPCQTGYLVSIESLKLLFEHLKITYGLKYLITSRLNQDCFESFFSRIRGFGGPNPNPTPAEFRYRFRLILLGGSVRAPKVVNSLDYCSSNYVSADLICENNINIFVNREPSQIDPANLHLSDEIKLNASRESTNELDYLAGYIAWSLKRKHPELSHFGTPTSGIPIVFQQSSSWIHMLSRGGLLTPNQELRQSILKCNSVFESMMEHLQDLPNLHSNLQQVITTEFPEVCKEIVEEFIKVRIKIKIKHLNASRLQLIADRKMKSVLQSYKPKNTKGLQQNS